MSNIKRLGVALLGVAAACQAHAQAKGPAAQYWIDVATTNMSIPGMPEEGGMGGGLLGGIFGGGMGGGMGANRGRTMQSELYVRAKPAGVEGTHAIPAAMNMGQSLPLLPIRPRSAEGGTAGSNDTPEKAKGRILVYWGCGDAIRPGQPRVLDLSKPDYKEFAQVFASHAAANRGAQGLPGHSVWPNERDSKRVPDNASLLGEHAVGGEGVPASLKFNVGAAYDFMPRLQISTKGMPKDGVQVGWKSLEQATGYFLVAQGTAGSGKEGSDMIFWTSSEKPENGWSLMTYQSPAQVAKLQQQKIVLPASATNCTIPKGIFDKADGSMLNMIAYGPEFNASYPARPAKASADWQPEWTARIRNKSTGMTMLGMEDSGDNRRGTGDDDGGNASRSPSSDAPNPVNLLKGLFSR